MHATLVSHFVVLAMAKLLPAAADNTSTAMFTFEATAYNGSQMQYSGSFDVPEHNTFISFLLLQNRRGAPLNLYMVNVGNETTPAYLISTLAGCFVVPVDYCFWSQVYVNGKYVGIDLTSITFKGSDVVRIDYATQGPRCGTACLPPSSNDGAVLFV